MALIDDAWNNLGFFIKRESWNQDYTKYAMIYFESHVLSPLSFAIRIDLQVGNLPACFFELRMMLESMVKCFWADLEYRDLDHFMDKLLSLENRNNKEQISTAKLLKRLGDDYCSLWGKLSKDWLHSEGFVKRIIDYTLEKADIPAYALASPMQYREGDIDSINELGSAVSLFRTLLKNTFSEWQKQLNMSV